MRDKEKDVVSFESTKVLFREKVEIKHRNKVQHIC